MSRQRMGIGTTGKITLTPQVKNESGAWVRMPEGAKPQRWQAQTYRRDSTGKRVRVTRLASTKAKAENLLREALLNEVPSNGKSAAIRPGSLVREAGTHWLATAVEGPSSTYAQSSREAYRGAFERHVLGSDIENLTLIEVNSVQLIERWLQGVADAHGAGSAKQAKNVLAGILNMAERYGAIAVPATARVKPVKSAKPKPSRHDNTRALTDVERQTLLDSLDSHPQVLAQDCGDLIRFLAATGARISEALALRWDDVDLTQRVAHIRGTKSAAANRAVPLPGWLVEVLSIRRLTDDRPGVVFKGPNHLDDDRPRDKRNVERVIRRALDDAGLEWARTHSFRRTVATRLHVHGIPLVEIADQLGHSNPAMTASVYLGRGQGDKSRIADLL